MGDRTILIIDDDESVRCTFCLMLQLDGYTTHAFSTAADGLAALRQLTPDALLLDLHLPVTDGLECLRRLRASGLHESLPVALLTADYFLDEAIARELKVLGAHIHFKPVWESDLRRIVAGLLAASADPDACL
jgi:CheY-like chemotaxis protein